MEDKKRIMDMVKEGKITVEEAIRLLEAMDSGVQNRVLGLRCGGGPPTPQRHRQDDPYCGGRRRRQEIKVNIPAALAKFAANFIPPEAKQQVKRPGH